MDDNFYPPHCEFEAVTITYVANEETKATVIHSKSRKATSHVLLLLFIARIDDKPIRIKR